MAKAKKIAQLSFVLPNKVGQLAAVSEIIASEKVNIKSLLARASGNGAEFSIVTDDNPKAKKALATLGVEIKDAEVVRTEIPDKAGRLRKIAKRLAEAGIDIHSTWATASSGKTTTCLFATSDNDRAVETINKKAAKGE